MDCITPFTSDELVSWWLGEQARLTSQLHDTLARLERLRSGLSAARAELADTARTREQRKEAVRQRQMAAALLKLHVKQVGIVSPTRIVIRCLSFSVKTQGCGSTPFCTEQNPTLYFDGPEYTNLNYYR